MMSNPLRTRVAHFDLRISLDAFKQWGNENNCIPFPDHDMFDTEDPAIAVYFLRAFATTALVE